MTDKLAGEPVNDTWECQRCGRSIAINYVSHRCPAKDEAHVTLPSVPIETFGERIAKLKKALRQVVDLAVWMSGSDSFSPGGEAHDGWIEGRPVIERALELLRRDKP